MTSFCGLGTSRVSARVTSFAMCCCALRPAAVSAQSALLIVITVPPHTCAIRFLTLSLSTHIAWVCSRIIFAAVALETPMGFVSYSVLHLAVAEVDTFFSVPHALHLYVFRPSSFASQSVHWKVPRDSFCAL